MISARVNVSIGAPFSRAWVEIDLAAVVENARTVARTAGTRLLPIVKANAYGLGAVAVCKALEAIEPWGYGVATVEEGAELRAAGISRPILVLLPAWPARFGEYRAARLTPVFDHPDALRGWAADGGGPFHLEIDTGMARGGVRWDDMDQVASLTDSPGFEGAFTQMHSAECDNDSVTRQLERYFTALRRLPRRPTFRHVANSAAALGDPRCALDLVRPGVYLYGGTPGGAIVPGRAVASIRARVASVRRVRSGESVSYNARWTAPRDTTIATLAIGYADGVPSVLGPDGRGQVLLRGTRCPIVGTVTMDLTLVDAGDHPVVPGDVATLLGEDQGLTITLADLVAETGVQPRGLLTALGARLPRIYA
jgi:alanine racemase